MSQLSHENIVTCAGARTDRNENIFIVMELMALGDMRLYLLNKAAYVKYEFVDTFDGAASRLSLLMLC